MFDGNLENLANKSIVILGMGKEGWSTYNFLRSKLPDKKLAVVDQRNLSDIDTNKQKILDEDPNITMVHFGDGYLTRISNYQVIFKSPGIPQTIDEIKTAKDNGALLASNTQLFMEFCQGITIGVTGTKGKSTTSAVIHYVLKESGLDSHLVGNIGNPPLEILDQINADSLVVLELSSHQLETLDISPHIAVVQDVTSEHLDYYADTESYQSAKTPISRFQKEEDLVIFNPQMMGATKIAQLSPGQHIRFSIEEGPDSVVFVRNGEIVRKDSSQRTEVILPITTLPLHGEHNLLNVMPAVIVGTLFNLTADQISGALKSFKSLPHRLELVHQRKGISYYNDSLATMPEAAIKALDSFNKPIVLLAGGYERNQGFVELAEKILEKKIVGLVLFKPTGKRLVDEIEKINPAHGMKIEFATQMVEAVGKANQMMEKQAEGIILMSPGSASFGLFENYQDRGNQFTQASREF